MKKSMINGWSHIWKQDGTIGASPGQPIFKQPLWIFFPVILIIGTLFSSLIPPFQSPDEQDHLKRAYLLSQGRIAMVNLPGESTGGYVDTGLTNYIREFSHILDNTNQRVTLENRQNAAAIVWSGHETFGSSPGVNYYFPLIYTPQALGLGLGKSLGMTVETSYFLARFFALAFSAFVLLVAFAIYRPSPFLIGLLLTPLMVFQFCSASQDGVSSALVVLTASLFMRITTDPTSHRSLFYLMAVAILILVTSRVNLLPILGLLYIAAYLAAKPARYYLIAIGVTALSLLWIAYALDTTVDNRVSLGVPVSEIVLYYVLHPLEFIAVLFRTLTTTQTVKFYNESFFGILGWLDTNIGTESIYILTLSCVALVLFSITVTSMRGAALPRLGLAVLAIAALILVFFLLLITWNPHPASIIVGVQGRYFWAPVILLSYGLTASWSQINLLQKIAAGLGLLAIMVITFGVTPKVLIDRYYAYDRSKDFTEMDTIITPVASIFTLEKGGFIDEASYSDNSLIIKGWGFFSDNEKSFHSDYSDNIPVTYLTIIRHDVTTALDNHRLRYSGFTLTILLDDQDKLKTALPNLCLFSVDPVLGSKQIQSNIEGIFECQSNH